ncbi:peptidylprolyl isomerase [Spirochaeta africana]|uniref:Parvulin-like peptidyl-prolyl isomerase n=1 Tax=Spirochaeta africana (strain ATCC 700263 / DSM 8902 / Z-7692) TaxID=889378 RepID=H9UJJ2_SPIAZ|nr:peptidyl-prolyl cis-trans isomerase [Spirochaeta africana]AFG37685.1 parvulin-like peptidyl-prolyl isomerase [Spirochaeta africana DSM 8902]
MQNTTRYFFSFMILFALLGAAPIYAQVLDTPVATVRLTETTVVTQRQLRDEIRMFEQQLRRSLSQEQRREVLDAKVNEILLRQGAARDGIRVTDSEINAAINQQRSQLGAQVSDSQFRQLVENQTGMSWDEYRQEIRNTLIQQRYVVESKQDVFEQLQEPSESDIRRVYEENETSFLNPSMRGFTHIFFDTRNVDDDQKDAARRRADRLYREIRSGERSFQNAVNYANDASDIQAGDFGYIQRGDQQAQSLLGRSFIDAVFELEEDQVSRVIESNLGFHIVRVTDKRSPRLLGLDDPVYPGQSMTVRTHIAQYIMQEQQQALLEQALEELIAELREDADINIFEDNLTW